MKLMRSRGHEAALFAMADTRGEATAYDRHFVPLTEFKSGSVFTRARSAARAIYSIEARRRMRRLIEEFRPDVAHVRNIYHHLTPSILWELKAQGIPVVYHINDFKLLCPSYNMVSASGRACERCRHGHFWNVLTSGCYAGGSAASVVLAAEAYLHQWFGSYSRCVDLFITPSHFAKQKLVENGWPPEKIEVLPHFQAIPAAIVPPQKGGPILYFGRLSKEKGVADLIAAMRRLPDVKLVIAGEGPQRGELERVVRDADFRNVTFLGRVAKPDLATWIANSQFTVFPSHAYETFGKSILESFAFARAVIASDLGSRRELVRDGENGLLYQVGNIDQLVRVISSLHDRTGLSRRMGMYGRDLVVENHSPDKHFEALEQIYDRLTSTKRKSLSPASSPPGLRIAFIGGRGVAGKYSGIETYYEETGKRLAQMGHAVTAYCRTYFTPDIAQLDGIRALRLPTIRSKHLETFVHTLLSTIHACFSKYDIVHYQTLGPSLFSLLPRLLGKKTIVTVQGLDWQRKKWGWFARQVLKAGEWSSARLPDRTVVVSRTLAGYYQSRYGKQVQCVPNGTRIRSRRSAVYLDGLGLKSGAYVLYLGRFSPEKNCDLLIRAFEKVPTTLKLALAGGSSHTDVYAAELRSHESDRIRVLDWLSGEALEEVLTNAALFVLPSDLEGSSLALLDAMGAGLCVLASDTPENCEVIGNAGFTFRKGDQQDLERMLIMLTSDERVRRTAGEAAQQRVRDQYLWSKVTTEVQNVYMEVARAGRVSKSHSGLAGRTRVA